MRKLKLINHQVNAQGRRRFQRPRVEALEERSLLSTITVTGTGDSIANDGVVTLREAITAANTNADPSGDTTPGDLGSDTIAFDIPGTGVHTIQLTSALPTISEPVVIDGYTEPGSAQNTLADGDNAVLRIELNRGNLAVNGLTITAGNSTVRGLVVNGSASDFMNAIDVTTNGGNRIEGNFLGPDATGTTDVGTLGRGVHIQDAPDNTIGGTTTGARNLISGNQLNIYIQGAGATRSLVEGNFIGTNADGTTRLPGSVVVGGGLKNDGVLIEDAPKNTIGGTTAGARNVITGATTIVKIERGGAAGNLVQGNFIGIDVTGTTPLASIGYPGVSLLDAPNNTIGGTTPGAHNVISGNQEGGILISGTASHNNLVQGNFIGTDANGLAAVANGEGVNVQFAGGNTIGGTTPGARNVISGNGRSANSGGGITLISGGNLVQGNFIGVDVNGDPLGNVGNGVFVEASAGNTIGGTTAGAGNVIAFNGFSGVLVGDIVGGTSSNKNTILSNAIDSNRELGIDLSIFGPIFGSRDGPTSNDPGDPDTGPNNRQNFPVLSSVTSSGGSTTIAGKLDSAPGTFRVEFFANDAADPSSFGEGQVFLGSADVTIDANQHNFTATLPVAVSPTQFVTATATDPAGDTSEFSQLVANLAITASSSSDPAPAGADLTYTITVTNTGTSSPSGPVTVTDTLPAGVTFVSATGGVTPVQGVLKLDLGIIPIGGSITATIVVRPNAAAAGTTITNTAKVTSTVSDPDSADNTVMTTTSIVAASAAAADLSVTVTDPLDVVNAGDDITYTITVVNDGPDAAANVKLTDVIPDHTTLVSFEAPLGFTVAAPPAGGTGTITATAASLADGARAVCTLVVRVAPNTPDESTIRDTATVTATTTDPIPTDQSDTVTTAVIAATDAVDLSVSLTKGPGLVTVGNELTYSIIVHNGGVIGATGVKLTDRLPAGVAFVSATGGVAPLNGILTFDLCTLDGGADATVSVVLVPQAAGKLTNTAEVKANEADAVATDNSDSLDTDVSKIATKTMVTPSTTTANRGEPITFVVSVTHPSALGAGPAGSVTLRDGNMDLGSAPLDAGRTATFTIPDLAGGSHSISASYAGDARFAPSQAAAVTVHVESAHPGGPVAVPDVYRMLARTTLAVSSPQGVLRNDLGADNRTAQARLVHGPAHGRLVFRTDGTFQYLPSANFQGTDTFTYMASDREGNSAPTVVRIEVESLRLEPRTVVVPGNPTDRVSVQFTWTVRDARFNNELGIIRVDDPEGSIGRIRPGDPRYLRAAASAGRMKVVFHSGQSAGISREIALSGGERYLLYFVQNASTAMVLARNAENRPERSPRVFFADPAANPDRFDHVRTGSRNGTLSLAWEDRSGGGDRDFNDMVLTIRAIRMGH
jgi:uncharacterized repeat protein (TIGR01451 family)